jgi:hypothetical protein
VENHDFDLRVLKKLLQQLEGEAAQAVTVGNHNFGDMATEYAFQKGLKLKTLPGEAGLNILDNFVLGIGFADDLTLEIFRLMGAADPCATHFLFFGLDCLVTSEKDTEGVQSISVRGDHAPETSIFG